MPPPIAFFERTLQALTDDCVHDVAVLCRNRQTIDDFEWAARNIDPYDEFARPVIVPQRHTGSVDTWFVPSRVGAFVAGVLRAGFTMQNMERKTTTGAALWRVRTTLGRCYDVHFNKSATDDAAGAPASA